MRPTGAPDVCGVTVDAPLRRTEMGPGSRLPRWAGIARFVEHGLTPSGGPQAHVRAGRLISVMTLMGVAYEAALLVATSDRSRTEAAVLVGLAAVAAAIPFLPWQRWPAWVMSLPAIVGVGLLTLGNGAAQGELPHDMPLFGLVFTYAALLLSPPWSLRLAALALAGLGVAVGAGHRSEQVLELAGAVVIFALCGLLAAVSTDLHRRHSSHLVALHTGLADLVAAQDEAEAAGIVGRLATNLLHCDGAVVAIREAAGSPILVGRGGHGLDGDYAQIRVDIDEEQSGAGVAVRTGQPVWIGDVRTSPYISRRIVTAVSASSALFLPLNGPSNRLGAIALWWTAPAREPDEFADHAVHLLTTQAGLVLARLGEVARLDLASLTDPLTGIANRRAFEAGMDATEPGALLILIDLDGFKGLNDSQGHPAGDRVLRRFARTLAGSTRGGDLSARIGGDEFAVVVDKGNDHSAAIITGRLRSLWGDAEAVGFSFGHAVRQPGESVVDWIQRADRDLYRAKRGRPALPGSLPSTVDSDHAI